MQHCSFMHFFSFISFIFPLFCVCFTFFATLCFISVVFNVIFLAPFYEFAASAPGEHEYVNMIGDYVCQSAYIYIQTCVCVCICMCEPAPQMFLLCIFAYSLHTHSIKHAFGSAAHSFMPSFAFRQIFVFMNRFFVCLPRILLISFFFFHFAHQSAFPLCNFWLTGNSYKRYKRPHQVGIPTLADLPFPILSHSPLIITVKRIFLLGIQWGSVEAWHLLYASFKVTKCWFIEGLDGKTNRNSLNFTWLNDLHTFFISFTPLAWHVVQAK